MEAGEEKGGWETGFYFLIFTDIVKMGWDTKPARNEGKKSCISSSLICGCSTPEIKCDIVPNLNISKVRYQKFLQYLTVL